VLYLCFENIVQVKHITKRIFFGYYFKSNVKAFLEKKYPKNLDFWVLCSTFASVIIKHYGYGEEEGLTTTQGLNGETGDRDTEEGVG
jgi:hypothetical protein